MAGEGGSALAGPAQRHVVEGWERASAGKLVQTWYKTQHGTKTSPSAAFVLGRFYQQFQGLGRWLGNLDRNPSLFKALK
jgi:hypothetical protein